MPHHDWLSIARFDSRGRPSAPDLHRLTLAPEVAALQALGVPRPLERFGSGEVIAATDPALVALDEPSQRLRLGSCKRSELALVNDLANSDDHVARFLKAFPRFASWQVEKVAIAPSLSPEARQAIETAGYLPQGLDDLLQGLVE